MFFVVLIIIIHNLKTMYSVTMIVALAAITVGFPQSTERPEAFPLLSRIETRDEVGQYVLQ